MVTSRLLAVGEGEGLDGDALLREAGLSRAAIEKPDDYVDIQRHVALGVAMTRALGPVNAGLHSGMQIFGNPRGALGFAVLRSGTHAAGLAAFSHFLSVANQSLKTSLVPEVCGAKFHLEMVDSLAELGHPAEALFAAWTAISRLVTATTWQATEVSFAHKARGPVIEHEQFFGCPVHFEADESTLLIDAEVLQLPILAAPHHLDGVIEQLGQELRLALGSTADLQAVEALLHELTAGGVDRASRHDPTLLLLAARQLLASRQLPLFEIAFLLGWQNVPDLKRALGSFET